MRHEGRLTDGQVVRASQDVEHLVGDVHIHVLLEHGQLLSLLQGLRDVHLEELRLDRVDHLKGSDKAGVGAPTL